MKKSNRMWLFRGNSSRMPVTSHSNLPPRELKVMIFPIGSSPSGKYFAAAYGVRTTLFGPASARFGSPSCSRNPNKSKKVESTDVMPLSRYWRSP